MIQVYRDGHLIARWDDATRTVTRWDRTGAILEQRPYTAAEHAAATATATQATADANEATLRSRAQTALTTNGEFLALAAPTNAQTLAQVKALTRQASALIRLELRALDTLAGT